EATKVSVQQPAVVRIYRRAAAEAGDVDCSVGRDVEDWLEVGQCGRVDAAQKIAIQVKYLNAGEAVAAGVLVAVANVDFAVFDVDVLGRKAAKLAVVAAFAAKGVEHLAFGRDDHHLIVGPRGDVEVAGLRLGRDAVSKEQAVGFQQIEYRAVG